MNLLSILLQAAGGANQWSGILMMVVVVAIFYFFMIRPQMKKQKEMTNYRSALKKGDRVVTTGGIYGKVYEVKDNYVMLEVAGDLRLKVDKSALLKDPSDTEQK